MRRRGPGSEPRAMRQQPLRDRTIPHPRELFAGSLDAAERGLVAALLAAAGAPKHPKSQYFRPHRKAHRKSIGRPFERHIERLIGKRLPRWDIERGRWSSETPSGAGPQRPSDDRTRHRTTAKASSDGPPDAPSEGHRTRLRKAIEGGFGRAPKRFRTAIGRGQKSHRTRTRTAIERPFGRFSDGHRTFRTAFRTALRTKTPLIGRFSDEPSDGLRTAHGRTLRTTGHLIGKSHVISWSWPDITIHTDSTWWVLGFFRVIP